MTTLIYTLSLIQLYFILNDVFMISNTTVCTMSLIQLYSLLTSDLTILITAPKLHIFTNKFNNSRLRNWYLSNCMNLYTAVFSNEAKVRIMIWTVVIMLCIELYLSSNNLSIILAYRVKNIHLHINRVIMINIIIIIEIRSEYWVLLNVIFVVRLWRVLFAFCLN